MHIRYCKMNMRVSSSYIYILYIYVYLCNILLKYSYYRIIACYLISFKYSNYSYILLTTSCRDLVALGGLHCRRSYKSWKQVEITSPTRLEAQAVAPKLLLLRRSAWEDKTELIAWIYERDSKTQIMTHLRIVEFCWSTEYVKLCKQMCSKEYS